MEWNKYSKKSYYGGRFELRFQDKVIKLFFFDYYKLLFDILNDGENHAYILISVWDTYKYFCIDISIVSPFVGGWAILEYIEAARKVEDVKIYMYESGWSAN